MRVSVSEAVFMLGLERSSDLIRGVAFAPLLSLVDHHQWAVSCRALLIEIEIVSQS